MKSRERYDELASTMLAAWTSQDVERVLACYSHDLRYRDPNTRGEVCGREAMARYLNKLFGPWVMTWDAREIHPLRDRDGAAVLWYATFRMGGGSRVVSAEGMDLVLFEGDLISRNEVYFDRGVLAPFVTEGGAT